MVRELKIGRTKKATWQPKTVYDALGRGVTKGEPIVQIDLRLRGWVSAAEFAALAAWLEAKGLPLQAEPLRTNKAKPVEVIAPVTEIKPATTATPAPKARKPKSKTPVRVASPTKALEKAVGKAAKAYVEAKIPAPAPKAKAHKSKPATTATRARKPVGRSTQPGKACKACGKAPDTSVLTNQGQCMACFFKVGKVDPPKAKAETPKVVAPKQKRRAASRSITEALKPRDRSRKRVATPKRMAS
jgi:hypothetical protein